MSLGPRAFLTLTSIDRVLMGSSRSNSGRTPRGPLWGKGPAGPDRHYLLRWLQEAKRNRQFGGGRAGSRARHHRIGERAAVFSIFARSRDSPPFSVGAPADRSNEGLPTESAGSRTEARAQRAHVAAVLRGFSLVACAEARPCILAPQAFHHARGG
jgi:hypothetical protein